MPLSTRPPIPTEANERLRRIAEFGRTGIGPLRTHLDEWAAFERGGELLTGGNKQRWFNNPCPWKEWERLASYMDFVTPEAAAVLRRGMDRDPAVKKPPRGQRAPFRLIVEHAVPVKTIGQAVRNDRRLWEPTALRNFLQHHYRRGVLTSAQDGALNAVGLRESMPAGWQVGGDPFARYHAVGLKRARIVGL